MAVTMVQVRAVLDATEPDYAQAVKLGPEALPHLEKLVKGADALLASKAVYLAALLQDECSVRIVREAAVREDPTVRIAAAAAARYLPCVPVSDILIPLVSDKDRGVQRVALESVRADATAELRATIERLMTSESDPSIQRAAEQVIRRISLGCQPYFGSAEEDESGLGGIQESGRQMGNPGVAGGMGNPEGTRAMGVPGISGGMGNPKRTCGMGVPGNGGGIAQIGMGQ